MLDTLSRRIARITIEEPATHANLSVYPLVGPGRNEPAYLTLEEALGAHSLSITEVSEAGAVPTIRLLNEASEPVLILDGEELVGAKQNRVVNLTILAPAKQALDIPVSCVEAGRWGYHSPEFSSAGRTVYASLRARKTERVSRNLCMAQSRAADQGEIWDDIAAKSARMSSRSPTGAMAQMFEDNRASLGSYAESFRARPGQCGALFAIRDEVVGFDLFDRPATLAKLYPKLISGYALDAIEATTSAFDVPAREKAADLLSEFTTNAEAQAFPAIGEGTDVRINGRAVVGAALVAGGAPIHLCGFRLKQDARAGHDRGRDHQSRLSRASVRRRRFERS